MQSSNSAHSHTTPREQQSEITSTGINTIPHTTTSSTRPKLSSILPPLVFGTATFNYQFNTDPYALNPTSIVSSALSHGIHAFDTSPYYGPAEEILGTALKALSMPRSSYYILTKAGRIVADSFDYSRSWIHYSVRRSLLRFNTDYLDVVYLHDVEFVSPAEVLTGINALRELRDEGLIHHVGICGYPVNVLAELAEMIKRETGEAVDIVQNYANFTVQNQVLRNYVDRFIDAGVDVVANASPLGMGLCRGEGVPVGAMGAWHPAPDGLKEKMGEAAKYVAPRKLETVALRFAMEEWLDVGQRVGVMTKERIDRHDEDDRIGVNVMGVSKISELEETMAVYHEILLSRGRVNEGRTGNVEVVKYIREHILGQEWSDHAWESPNAGFVNARKVFGLSEEEPAEYDRLAQETK